MKIIAIVAIILGVGALVGTRSDTPFIRWGMGERKATNTPQVVSGGILHFARLSSLPRIPYASYRDS